MPHGISYTLNLITSLRSQGIVSVGATAPPRAARTKKMLLTSQKPFQTYAPNCIPVMLCVSCFSTIIGDKPYCNCRVLLSFSRFISDDIMGSQLQNDGVVIFSACAFNPFTSGILYFFRSPMLDYFQ